MLLTWASGRGDFGVCKSVINAHTMGGFKTRGEPFLDVECVAGSGPRGRQSCRVQSGVRYASARRSSPRESGTATGALPFMLKTSGPLLTL